MWPLKRKYNHKISTRKIKIKEQSRYKTPNIVQVQFYSTLNSSIESTTIFQTYYCHLRLEYIELLEETFYFKRRTKSIFSTRNMDSFTNSLIHLVIYPLTEKQGFRFFKKIRDPVKQIFSFENSKCFKQILTYQSISKISHSVKNMLITYSSSEFKIRINHYYSSLENIYALYVH